MLLIPGFHAFALALQGLMDVYESGGDVLHYLWFDPCCDQTIAQFRDHLREYESSTHIGLGTPRFV